MSFENRGRERNRAIVQIPGPGRLFPEPSAQSSSFHGNGRSPSPHLRGNPHLAAQMRSELLQQSHDVQHQGLPQVGAEPAARADGISPEKRKEMEQMLETMGFIDKAVNAAMMRKHNCQLDKVLDDLIAGIGSPSCGAYTPGGDSTRRTDASGAYSRQPVPVEDRRTAPRSLHPSPQHVDNAEHKGTQSLDLASLLGFTCIEDRSDEKVVRAILEKEDQAKAKASTQFGARERILASSSGRQKGFLQVNSVDTATSSVGRPTSLLPASSSHSAGGSASGWPLSWQSQNSNSAHTLPSLSSGSDKTMNSMAQIDSFALSQDTNAASFENRDFLEQPAGLSSVYAPVPASQMHMYTPISGYSEMPSQQYLSPMEPSSGYSVAPRGTSPLSRDSGTSRSSQPGRSSGILFF